MVPLGLKEGLKRDLSFISLCLWPTLPLCVAIECWGLSGDAGKANILRMSVYTSGWFGFPQL